ncbi:uncharacterized protein si:ch211-278p9.3 isoform X2 [Danio rerio]
MNLNEKREQGVHTHTETSPELSCVSMKSHQSMPVPLQFSDGPETSEPENWQSGCVSVRSIQSMPLPLEFSDGAEPSDPKVKRDDVLVTHPLTCTDSDRQTLISQRVKDKHKTSMKKKCENLFEGNKLEENQTLLNSIYTQLYIIEGESEGVNEEHEVLQMERTARTQDTPIYCSDIFKPLQEPEHEEKDQIKTVLTKGIAGIGKTVSVQKFILDWSEGKASQDVDFMFVLPFRELNLIKDHQYSLHRLLLDFHPELQDLDSEMYEECKVVFIFDGLDESRITLKFSDIERVSDVNESSSVAVLMSNLIRGDLLPSAHIWITSRPAAANQIPSKYISRLTEIQGFNDSQKEEYFRKRISDVGQARRIISHIRRSRSLHIMCHIPVFCWISATVLQKLLNEDDRAEIPQTLTEMYIHFLLTQINMRNQKYEERDPERLLKSSRDMIVKLAELAFNQLMKGNVMFYEEDLIESGIDVTGASVYSGICTEILKEESVIHQRKVYSFLHLSFQEFLSAFCVFNSQLVENEKNFFLHSRHQLYSHCNPLYKRVKSAVDESLQSGNGHLDLFLRFLLGISLNSNQRLLQDLLTCTEKSLETIKRITGYIKNKIKGDEHLSAGRCINLFLCLLEMKDQTLYREIQKFVKSQTPSVKNLSPSHCSTIIYMLQISEEALNDEFDLKKYKTSDEGRRRLIPAVVNCRKALVKRDDVLVTHPLTCTDSDRQTLISQRVKDKHKTSMKKKCENLFEGNKLEENQTLLNSIYTQLYIIEGESEGVNEEHEVLQMERTARTQDTPIYCSDIFKPLQEPEHEEKDQIKTVLTKGIAGIGKTVSVQKFILDWSEGKASQDVDFMFVLPFRELNLIKDHQYSLHTLLLDFHPELQDLDSEMYEECKVVFIFDGLDESRITLKFSDIERVSDVNESSSVAVLMSNLIRGDLLPSAHIWITSRPAAANQIPSIYISRLTEIQGFNDSQKEEYFRKRISDVGQARRIISHIRRSRSLHIMCHIPVFCWISATVLQKLLNEDDRAEIPQTLTEMYIHFLLTQINMRNQKYEERDPERLLKSSRDMIVKLAELAFNQLMKGNVMFYEEDLIESGIDVTGASVYSGICTEILKEESVIHQRKVYSFLLLSFQEFLSAFCVFNSQLVENEKNFFLHSRHQLYSHCNPLYKLVKSAVDESLQSGNGHLDLFLRFLLGISLNSNQRLLQDLLTCTEKSLETIKRITGYIKNKIKGDEQISAGRCINLFLCLLEMKDQTLYREIQKFVKSQTPSVKNLSPPHCSTIIYMLQISEEALNDEFDLKKYKTSDEGRRRLIPAVVNCRKALLADCSLTGQCCESLSSSLQSPNSIRELDLINNDLQDTGVKLLSDGLKSSHCQLEILRLASCQLSGQCCESLSSFLQSSNSLRELDLSNNDLQDSGVKLLSDGLKSSHCQLEILRLSGCMVTEEGCCFLTSALRLNPSHLRELYLSYNNPGQSLVELLSDSNYRLDTLNVDHGGDIRIKTGPQKYICDLTLDVNTAHNKLALSEGNRTVTCVKKKQPYPVHPKRFDECLQVLSRESLTGRCYWEAEWSGNISISVVYNGISRKEWSDDSLFGFNEKSWSLIYCNGSFTVGHGDISIEIHVPHCSNRAGVYLDHSAGTLSFYSVSDTRRLTHLHTFKIKFTETLYAGIGFFSVGSVSLCGIKQLPVRKN